MRKNVLILEDNQKTLDSLKQAIETINNNQIKVYTATTYEEACFQAFSLHMDVFVLDIVLSAQKESDMSGIHFAQKLRENVRYMHTPIIFLTCLADIGNEALHTLHCFDYLEKPFPPEEVAKKVELALGFCSADTNPAPVFMRKDGILYVLFPKDILYVEVNMHVLYIHMKQNLLTIPNRTLKNFLKCDEHGIFVQCSRNTAVNCQYINHIDTVNHYLTLKESQKRIEISMLYLKKIQKGYDHV